MSLSIRGEIFFTIGTSEVRASKDDPALLTVGLLARLNLIYPENKSFSSEQEGSFA
jgi:hypothetical protein